jgi:hypothetical protein
MPRWDASWAVVTSRTITHNELTAETSSDARFTARKGPEVNDMPAAPPSPNISLTGVVAM